MLYDRRHGCHDLLVLVGLVHLVFLQVVDEQADDGPVVAVHAHLQQRHHVDVEAD